MKKISRSLLFVISLFSITAIPFSPLIALPAFILFPNNALAYEDQSPVQAEVIKVAGDVKYNGQVLHNGTRVEKSGILFSGPKSFARLYIKDWGSFIFIGPNSKMHINLSKANNPSKYNLANGSCRWSSTKDHSAGKDNLAAANKNMEVKTKTAAFGIRGTDFIVTHDKKTGASEIVVFHGNVLFQNRKNKKDSVLLKEKQWGGLGGEHGNKIAPIKDLDDIALANYKKNWVEVE